MTIWILALLLIGLMVAIGYSTGAIRMAAGFIGILIALAASGLAGKLFTPLLGAFGVKTPIMLWALPPMLGFLLVSIIFEIIGIVIHKKVDVYYKYKAGDLRLALFERLNSRLGACLGVLNGTAYTVIISFVIYAISYCTIPVASAEGDPRTMRIVNALGRDLQSTKMHRVAMAMNPLTKEFYQAADVAGLVYHHPLLEARLLRYPGLLSLGERDEFLAIASDSDFAQMRLRGAPIKEVMSHPKAQAVFSNPELQRTLWETVKPDLADLGNYLTNGVSAKYTERILGRWVFDSSGTIAAYRRAKPNTTALEAQRIRVFMNERFGQVMLVAAPDHVLVLKNIPQGQPAPGAPAGTRNLKGMWKEAGTISYDAELEGGTDKRTLKFEGSRLVVTGDNVSIAFVKQD